MNQSANGPDPRLMKEVVSVWKGVDKTLSPGIPPVARKFVGKGPGKRLAAHPLESWHQAVIYALSGQNDSVVIIMRGAALRVAASFPNSSRYLFQSAQVFRWCALRTGLLGWAEVWDVPVAGEKLPGPPYSLGTNQLEHFLEPESSEEFRKFYGGLDAVSGLNSSPSGDVAGLNHLVEALERSVIGLRDPQTNDVGLSEDRLLELVEFYARMIRMWMGLPQEQSVPEPDFRVDLPPEFQGFGPQVR